MSRICIIAKDIQLITGKSERQCRNIFAHLKVVLNKEKHQEITIQELCEYLGIKIEDVLHLFK
jgi:flagellin-specific chaperone FliS